MQKDGNFIVVTKKDIEIVNLPICACRIADGIYP